MNIGDMDVAGRGVAQGIVLGDEIERAGAHAAGHEGELVAPVAGQQPLVAREQQHEHVCAREAVDEHFYGREAALLHQHLGADKRYGDDCP